MKIYDLFPFFNELQLLELRIAELSPVVDRFCAVELPVTFTDRPKPLYLAESGHYGVDIWTPPSYPSGPHPTVDWFQRRQLAYFAKQADPGDWIILSDVDEIPNRDAVTRIIENDPDHPVALQCQLYYHRVDLRSPILWQGPIMAKRSMLGAEPDMQELRNMRCSLPTVADAGWHFSWLGDGEAIKHKLTAVDIVRDGGLEAGLVEPPMDSKWLQECYEGKREIFSRENLRPKRVPIVPGVNQPHGIEAWLARFPQYAGTE